MRSQEPAQRVGLLRPQVGDRRPITVMTVVQAGSPSSSRRVARTDKYSPGRSHRTCMIVASSEPSAGIEGSCRIVPPVAVSTTHYRAVTARRCAVIAGFRYSKERDVLQAIVRDDW